MKLNLTAAAILSAAFLTNTAHAGTVLDCTPLLRADGSRDARLSRPYVDIQEDHVTVTLTYWLVGQRRGLSRTAYYLAPTGARAWSDPHGHGSLVFGKNGRATLVIKGMTASCTL